MKRIFALIFSVLLASSAWAGTVQLDSDRDGKIDVDRLPTVSFFQESDPTSPELGQIWWNNSTAQLKVAGALGVYAFNATSLVEWDTTPEAFSFADVANATTETLYTSDAITVSGINHPAAISVSGDASAKYSINNATATATNGTVSSGDEVRAVVTSSAAYETAVNATVTIGGVSDAFSVTTAEGPIFEEYFEGTGAPSGWLTGSGSPNYDYTASAISGAQSMLLTNAVVYSAAFTNSTALTGTFSASFESIPASSMKFFQFLTGSTSRLYAQLETTGKVKFGFHGSTSWITSSTLSAGTAYDISFTWTAANGYGGAESMTVKYREHGASSWAETQTINGPTTAYVINGITMYGAAGANVFDNIVVTK